MSKYTLFIGTRRSGKTYRAIEEARRVGSRVLVIAPTQARAEAIGMQYLVFASHCRSVPMCKPDAIVIEHVEKMSAKAVLDAIAAAIDKDAPIWATAHPPSTVEGAQTIEALAKAGFVSVSIDEPAPSAGRARFAELAKVLQSQEAAP
jgi:hypothetical protein